MAVKPIPEGFHTVTPYLFAEGVPRLHAVMPMTKLDMAALQKAYDG